MLNKKFVMNVHEQAGRLETPRAVGYRVGMTSPGIIGRRLGHLYEVPDETPRRFGELLQVLDQRVDSE